jgi:hypothetical protein
MPTARTANAPSCPWGKSSMTFFHLGDAWKRRGFPRSATVTSCSGGLDPRSARGRRFFGERLAAPLPLLVRIDARRPASWIALATALLAGLALLGGQGPSPGIVAAAWIVGTLVTVAAIGEVPLELCDGGSAGRPRRFAAWLWQRFGWPLAGLLVATAAAQGGGCGGVPASLLLAAVVAAAIILVARLRTANAADSASLALAGGFATGALLFWLGGFRSGTESLAAAALLWAGAGLAAWTAAGLRAPVAGWPDWSNAVVGGPPRTGEGLRFGVLPSQGPLRRLLTRVSMLSSLAAMVGWLFLDPERTALYGLLAGAWFVALAVPRAALLDGMAVTVSWAGIFRSAADDRDRSRPFSGPLSRPLPAVFSAHASLSCAAILAWPALVAAALAAGSPARGWQLVAIAAVLAGAAIGLALSATVSAVVGASGETLQAGLLALTVALVIAATALPPSLPRLPSWGRPAPAGQSAVERRRGSCQTPHTVHLLGAGFAGPKE